MTQSQLILRDLKRGKKITPLHAYLAYGCLRLGARIFELRKKHQIHTTMIPVGEGRRVASYRLLKAAS